MPKWQIQVVANLEVKKQISIYFLPVVVLNMEVAVVVETV